MDPASRHQCLIYEGPPSRHLAALAEVVRQKLNENKRCLYLNSEPMVAGMRSYLAAAGVDVPHETANAKLVLSSERHHLADGRQFDVDQMIRALEGALKQALKDGYQGLWATGDMTWELGPDKDFSRLLEYEWRLEEFFRANQGAFGRFEFIDPWDGQVHHDCSIADDVLQLGTLAETGGNTRLTVVRNR